MLKTRALFLVLALVITPTAGAQSGKDWAWEGIHERAEVRSQRASSRTPAEQEAEGARPEKEGIILVGAFVSLWLMATYFVVQEKKAKH